jgi:hypothetical protein
MARLICSGKPAHRSTTAAKSGSLALSVPDSVPRFSEIEVFDSASWGGSNPVPPSIHLFRFLAASRFTAAEPKQRCLTPLVSSVIIPAALTLTHSNLCFEGALSYD